MTKRKYKKCGPYVQNHPSCLSIVQWLFVLKKQQDMAGSTVWATFLLKDLKIVAVLDRISRCLLKLTVAVKLSHA